MESKFDADEFKSKDTDTAREEEILGKRARPGPISPPTGKPKVSTVPPGFSQASKLIEEALKPGVWMGANRIINYNAMNEFNYDAISGFNYDSDREVKVYQFYAPRNNVNPFGNIGDKPPKEAAAGNVQLHQKTLADVGDEEILAKEAKSEENFADVVNGEDGNDHEDDSENSYYDIASCTDSDPESSNVSSTDYDDESNGYLDDDESQGDLDDDESQGELDDDVSQGDLDDGENQEELDDGESQVDLDDGKSQGGLDDGEGQGGLDDGEGQGGLDDGEGQGGLDDDEHQEERKYTGIALMDLIMGNNDPAVVGRAKPCIENLSEAIAIRIESSSDESVGLEDFSDGSDSEDYFSDESGSEDYTSDVTRSEENIREVHSGEDDIGIEPGNNGSSAR